MLIKNQNWYSSQFRKLTKLENLITHISAQLDNKTVKYPQNLQSKVQLYKEAAKSIRMKLGIR